MLINCVFEGGGIKGLAFIGVLRFLEGRGFKIKAAGGTSIGSVFASLVKAGFNSYQLEELVNDFNIDILKQTEDRRVDKIITSIKEKGVYSIGNFEKYISSLLKAKNKEYFKDYKFGEDYLLKIVAMDFKQRKQVILPNDLGNYQIDKDNFKVATAVAMSCSIPIYFRPYKINDNIFVDGGIINNFPITLFKDDDVPTIGFRLSDDLISKKSKLLNKYKINKNSSSKKEEAKKFHIVEIDTLSIKATDFKKGLDRKMDLYLAGYDSVRRYFYDNFRVL